LKKVFRPFWSFDIRKTEDWLHKMALEGFLFVKLDAGTRLFYFEEMENKKEIQFHVEYNKEPCSSLPMNLVKSGWMPAYQGTRWHVIYNVNKTADILRFPVRDGIIKRNRIMLYIFAAMTVYIILTTLLFLTLSGVTIFISGGTLSFDSNIFWFGIFLAAFMIWLLAPYAVVKLYQTNKQFW